MATVGSSSVVSVLVYMTAVNVSCFLVASVSFLDYRLKTNSTSHVLALSRIQGIGVPGTRYILRNINSLWYASDDQAQLEASI